VRALYLGGLIVQLRPDRSDNAAPINKSVGLIIPDAGAFRLSGIMFPVVGERCVGHRSRQQNSDWIFQTYEYGRERICPK
jgi:hypothetical protein